MAKLQQIVDKDGKPMGWMHWCSGCGGPHSIFVEQPHPSTKARWAFDGDQTSPTFSPSIRCYTTRGKWVGTSWIPEGPEITTCHYFIRRGRIEFCGDSLHALRGKTVDLLEYPESSSSSPEQKEVV